MKIIKVDSCRKCPRPTKYNMKMKNVCQFKHIELDNFPNIPEWCPLENEQGLIPALDTLQGYLEKGCYIDYGYGESYGDKKVWLYRSDGDLIASGKNIEELRVNLVKKEA